MTAVSDALATGGVDGWMTGSISTCGGWGSVDDKVDVDFEKKDGLRLRVRVVGSIEFDDMGVRWACVTINWNFLARFLKLFIDPDLPELILIGI